MNEMPSIHKDFSIRRPAEGPYKPRIVPAAMEAPLPPDSVFERTLKPLWESPESQIFHDWYAEQSTLAEAEQSDAFREFSILLSLGRAELPRHSAQRTIQDVRHGNLSEEI